MRQTDNGKNWKEWYKQLTNNAVAMNTLRVLDDSQPQPQPPCDPNGIDYTLFELSHPSIKTNMTREQITEAKKASEYDQYGSHKNVR
jgi:hypothetical protein